MFLSSADLAGLQVHHDDAAPRQSGTPRASAPAPQAQRSPFGRLDGNSSTPQGKSATKSARKASLTLAAGSAVGQPQIFADAVEMKKTVEKKRNKAKTPTTHKKKAIAGIKQVLARKDAAASAAIADPGAAQVMAPVSSCATRAPTTQAKHICRACGVGPLASAAQLHEHNLGKRHLHRMAKMQRQRRWTPSSGARCRARDLAHEAWKQAAPATIAAESAAAPQPQQLATATAAVDDDAPETHSAPVVEDSVSCDTAGVVEEGEPAGEDSGAAPSAAAEPACEPEVAVCHAVVASTGRPCTLRAKANGRCGRHKAAKFAPK